LKVYRSDWRSYGEVRYELDLLAHLHRHGVAVALPLPRADGHRITTLAMPEGPRQAVLYAFAPGRPFRWPFYQDQDECRALGVALGALHDAADRIASPLSRPAMDRPALLDAPLAEIAPHLADRPADWLYLVGLAERLRRRLTALVAEGLDWGVRHGDYHPGNATIDADGTVTVYDFDACGPGWRMLDLVRVHAERAKGPEGEPAWEAFLAGYAGRRHGGEGVAPADPAALPALVAAAGIYGIGLKLRGIARTWWDSWWLPLVFLDEQLAFLRRWEADFLA
jgi:Ser/Thr protein kinase RdoA (MazF antagonist)